jgi:hypothetical protein
MRSVVVVVQKLLVATFSFFFVPTNNLLRVHVSFWGGRMLGPSGATL